MPATNPKTERIDIRTDPKMKELLQQAAAATHKNVSEFLLDAGLQAAEETLAGRHVFHLDEDHWNDFQKALNRPVTNKPHLAKLLNEPGVLEPSQE